MNEYTDQISGYFNQVPMWPLVLLAVAIVISGIYELFHRKRRANAIDDFRSGILSTLSGLYPEPTNWPKSIDTYLCARLPVMQEIIEDYDPTTARGYGFLYYDSSADAFWDAIKRARELFRDEPLWTAVVRRAMTQEFSWQTAAQRYEELYAELVSAAGERAA